MNYRSIIKNFRRMTAEQFPALKSALSLSMSEEALSYCVTHYQKHEVRDPYVDELRMLDALYVSLETDVNALALTELLTNNDYIAATYADLLRKRKALDPNGTHPCTLPEAARIGGAYLFRSGRSNPLRSATLIPEHTDNTFPPLGYDEIAAPSSAFRLRILPFETSTPCKEDLLMLLIPKAHEPLPTFQKSVEEFLKNDLLKPYLKTVISIRKNGLLRELLELTNHLWIDLSAFSHLHVPMPMTVLSDHYQGCRILRISKNGVHEVPKLLREAGLEGFIFAQITDNGKFTFSREKDETFSIHPQFMRKLFRYRPSIAKIASESTASRTQILHRAITDRSSAYLSRDCRINCDEVIERNGLCCSAASAMASGNFFKSALYTVLAPVVSLCACGVSYTDQLLSVGMELPQQIQSSHVMGSCIAQILGLYRAQAELTLPTQAVTIHEENCESPSISAFSVASGKAIPSRFAKLGSTVYCVAPQADGNGLPDFNSLRRLLERITALGRQGMICGVKLLCGESVTDGLQAMQGTLGYRLADDSVAAEGTLDFAILLESDASLEFRAVATTVQRIPQDKSIARIPNLSKALNRAKETKILVFSQKCDSDALALTSYLTGRGINAKIMFCNSDELPALTLEILTSQAVILCKNAPLPEDARISFALETLQRAGGCVISFDNTPNSSFLVLHDGIHEMLLQEFCKN